jgi:hypothetical protein
MVVCACSFWFYSFYANKFLVTNFKNVVLKGVAKEAQMILDIEHCRSTSEYTDFFASQVMRSSIATALVKLEEELAPYAG